MSRTVKYKEWMIKSTPNKLRDEKFEFSPNGIIQINRGDCVDEIMTPRLNIPDLECGCMREEEADLIFIKYAKKYIDGAS